MPSAGWATVRVVKVCGFEIGAGRREGGRVQTTRFHRASHFHIGVGQVVGALLMPSAAWATVLLALVATACAYPEHIDKLFDRPKTSSLAASISLMATEDMVPPVQQQRQGSPEQQRQSHIVQALEAEQQQQHRSPSTSAAAADDGASTSTLHRIAGHIAKRTVVLATDSVEQFKSTGIPAFWLAMLMVLGAVAIFLCCWCGATPRTRGALGLLPTLLPGARCAALTAALTGQRVRCVAPLAGASRTSLACTIANEKRCWPPRGANLTSATVLRDETINQTPRRFKGPERH